MVLGRRVIGWGPLQVCSQGSPRPGGTFQPGPGPQGAPAQADQGGYPDVRNREFLAPGAALSLAGAATAGPVAGHGAGGDVRSPGRVSTGGGGRQRKGPRRREGRLGPTCLAVVAEEALWADTQVGPATVLAPASVLAGPGVAGVHLWRTPRESARAAGGCLGEGGEDSGKKGRGGRREAGRGRRAAGRAPRAEGAGDGPLPLAGTRPSPPPPPWGPSPRGPVQQGHGDCPHPPAL